MTTENTLDNTQQPVVEMVGAVAPELDHEDAMLQELLAQSNVADAEVVQLKSPEVEAPVVEQAKNVAHEKGDPTAAIIALRRKNQEMAHRNAVLEGQVQAYASMAKAPEQAVQFEPEPVVSIDSLRAEKLSLAEQFDAGDISAREMEARRQALDDQEWQLRQESMQPIAQPQNDLYLDQATAALEQQYPVLSILTADDLSPLADLARRSFARQGIELSGSQGTLMLRTEIAKLATQHFGGGLSQQSTEVVKPTQPLSPAAQARESKMAMAAAMPPDVSRMGSAGSTGISESELMSQLSGKSEDEQMTLLKSMPGLAKKLLGG